MKKTRLRIANETPEQKRERLRGYGRARHDRVRSDPEKWAAYLEKKRKDYAKRAGLEREAQRAWRKANPEKVREYKSRHYHKHKAKQQTKNRARYLRDRKKVLERQKADRAANPDKYREQDRALRARNPERFRLYAKRFRDTNRASTMLSGIKSGAKQTGLPMDLDREWFQTRLDAGVCELSGLPFDLTGYASVGGRGPNIPSVDRINPSGGYTKDNCRMILWWLNRAMINLGDEYCLNVFRQIFIKRGEIAARGRVKMAA